jgi:hypothetical protein
MPGMTGPSGAVSAALATAFKSALLSEGTIVFLIFVLLAITWVTCRELLLARARTRLFVRLAASRASRFPEPAGRRVLRIGFGILWIFDGLLQAQPAMPGGMPSRVLATAVAGSPGWLVRTVGWAAAGWSAHPVEAAAGAVWVQLGVGVWLLSAASPRWSRAAGLVSLGWGLVVWIFGEAFGSMLVPGVSWLMGAPGAALFYCAAGLLLALPPAVWHDGRLGRSVLRASGAVMLAFATLQAWPGRGFWQGKLHGQPGSLAAGIDGMAAARQPAMLHNLVSGAGSIAASHGFAFNLTAVIVLAATGCCLLTGRAAVARPAAFAAIVLCVADWVFVQDLGFLGGLGTDPNSMVPQALILTAGLVAMAAVPAAASEHNRSVSQALIAAALADTASGDAVLADTVLADTVLADTAPAQTVLAHTVLAETAPTHTAPGETSIADTRLADIGAASPAREIRVQPERSRLQPGRAVRSLGVALGTASTSSVLALWAGAMVLLGAVPMALATILR